jgi:hypothetical protein
MNDGQLIDFDTAEVISPMIYPPQPRLVVSGVLPNPDLEVTLVPLEYVSQPPYHGIQVVAKSTARGPHVSQPIANVPFSVELDLEGYTGSEGIDVIGETKTKQIDLTSEPPPEAVQLPADTSSSSDEG